MRTCKYCGTNLYFLGEYEDKAHFHCSYCDLTFEIEETCVNRQRKKAVPDSYEVNYYRPTKELLKIGTIELFYLLKECRKDWYSIYQLLYKVTNINPNEILISVEDEQVKKLFEEYKTLTKQKFIIENIILERTGYVPEKLTTEFLDTLVNQGTIFSKKPMYIYIRKEKKVISN